MVTITLICLLFSCCYGDKINLKPLVGPRELAFLSSFDPGFNVFCSISNIRNSSNYWYSYSRFEVGIRSDNYSIISDVITNDLNEYENGKNKYRITEFLNNNDAYLYSPVSCPSVTNSNIFTCYGSTPTGIYCNIYNSKQQTWLDSALRINYQKNDAHGSYFSIACFNDLFLIIWSDLDCSFALGTCKATSHFSYSLIDSNNFTFVARNVSIFDDLPIQIYSSMSITNSDQNPQQLLFAFNYDGAKQVYMYAVQYDTSAKLLQTRDGIVFDAAATPPATALWQSIPDVVTYVMNDELYWILPLVYDDYSIHLHVFDDTLKNLTKTKVQLPIRPVDYPIFILGDVVTINFGSFKNKSYFGIINVFEEQYYMIGGNLAINFTAVEFTENIGLNVLNNQMLLWEDHPNSTDPPTIFSICVDQMPNSDQLFLSWFNSVSSRSLQGQTWQFEIAD